MAIELPAEEGRYLEKIKVAKSIDSTCYYVADVLWYIGSTAHVNYTKKDFDLKVSDNSLLKTFSNEIARKHSFICFFNF
jgi:hypothetical protein